MSDWWQSLSGVTQVFWCIAIAASVFQLLLFAGSLISGHDFDHAPAHGDSGSSEGLKILSVRVITAFLVGFGWAGALFLGRGMAVVTALVLAVIAGGIFMAIIYVMMRSLVSLKSSGTLDYTNAIGATGHVYVTIPANRSGQGQVEILVQGRLVTTLAVTGHSQPLPPRATVVVKAVEAPTLLVVEPLF